VIDLGPEGGVGGGRVVAEGPPEVVAGVEESHTGRFLREILGPERVVAALPATPPRRRAAAGR
jgi:excinuclease ABC subunit A